MSKIILSSIITIACLFLFCGCKTKDNAANTNAIDEQRVLDTEEAVEELNKNSDIGFPLLMNDDDIESAQLPYSIFLLEEDVMYEQMPHDPYGEFIKKDSDEINDYHVLGLYSVYPYDPSKEYTFGDQRLTHIIVYTPEYHILDIRIGDEVSKAKEVLESFKYSHVDINDFSQYEYEELLKRYCSKYYWFRRDDDVDKTIDEFFKEYDIYLYQKYDINITMVVEKNTNTINLMDVRVYNYEKLMFIHSR